MPSVIVRGRAAWICGIILGIILLIIGIVTHQTFLIIAGVGFLVFGLIMLIISFATGGQSD
jgi:hypothetical protein